MLDNANDRIRVLIDCDTGIDDALAILYLCRKSGVEIVAAGSVHGNVPAELGAINTLRVLEVASLQSIPVAIGARRPLAQSLNTAEHVHGQDGLGNVNMPVPNGVPTTEPAPTQMIRLARTFPGELTILATGPLTNLALALLLDPDLPSLVRGVVVMGGAVYAPGNVTMDAEANIWCDPEAADLVLSAGWPLTLVGLDVTSKAVLTPADVEPLESNPSPIANFAWRILQHYFDFHLQYYGERMCHLHDPLAAGIAVDPTLATYVQTPVRVELRGQYTRGATIGAPPWSGPVPDGPPLSVATNVEADRFKASFIHALT